MFHAPAKKYEIISENIFIIDILSKNNYLKIDNPRIPYF